MEIFKYNNNYLLKMLINLDKADKRILFELDKNARIPETKLAKIIGKSKESVRYRINKLQNEGIITDFTIWIDPTKLGFNSVKIYLNLANKPENKKAFIDYVKSDKRLMWLGIADGAWNAGLTYFVKSNQEFFELKNELFSKFILAFPRPAPIFCLIVLSMPAKRSALDHFVGVNKMVENILLYAISPFSILQYMLC